MDLGGREEDAEREAAAGQSQRCICHHSSGCCQSCQRSARVAVAVATVMLVTGLVLCALLFAWTAASEADQTPEASGRGPMEQLRRCQRERQDLSRVLHAVSRDSRCSLCPVGWLWWRARCYYFSVGLREDRRWNDSAEFCRQHNSSLAVIEDAAEMDFIQGLMREFPQFPYLWVGLTDAQQEGRWLWWDGTDVQHYMPLSVEWDADHRDCADLRGGGRLFAASCEAYGPWACKRDS